jgi:hypothetical protein
MPTTNIMKIAAGTAIATMIAIAGQSGAIIIAYASAGNVIGGGAASS